MLTGAQMNITKVTLEFLHNVIPVFECFLTLFQKCGPTVHLVYDSMCHTILKLMRRFMRGRALEGKYGPDLSSVECEDVKSQLADKELVLGDGTRNALSLLKPDQQKLAILGIRSFYKTAIAHLQLRLPFSNTLLRELGSLNPSKRKRKSTSYSIQSLSRTLQPQLDVSDIVDEWKLYQIDTDVDNLDSSQQVEHYWNAVFQLRAIGTSNCYKSLPLVVRSGLVLAQTNAESERSLSINARLVTKDRSRIGDTTIVGLRAVKKAVRFYDPTNQQPDKIPISKDLKLALRGSHAAYQARLEEERLEEENKREQNRLKVEETERLQRDKEKLAKSRNSIEKSEEDLSQKEAVARADVDAADELLNDATTKLRDAVSGPSVNKQSVNVASMMLDTAKLKREEAMQRLDYLREKQKVLDTKTHKLLEKAIPVKSKATGMDDEQSAPKKAKR